MAATDLAVRLQPAAKRDAIVEARRSAADRRDRAAGRQINGGVWLGERLLVCLSTDPKHAVSAARPSARLRRMPSADRARAAAEDLARAGLRDAAVKIVAYDPAWPAAFEAERARLSPLLDGVEIHHVGSTAVPGLAAKPVIDMMAPVCDLDAPIGALTRRAGYRFPRAFNARHSRTA